MSERLNPSCSSPGEWLAIEAVAELTGEPMRTWQHRGKAECARARAEQRAPLARKARPPSGRSKRVWHFHRSIDARLTRYPSKATREDRGRRSLVTVHPVHKVDQAHVRARWLREWRTLCDGPERNGRTEAELAARIIEQARATEGGDFEISLRSLQLWRRNYYTVGADGQIRGVEALLDLRGTAGSGEDSATAGRSPEAIDYFYSLYQTQARISLTLCHETTVRESSQRGWAWPKSLSATRKWIAVHDNKAVTYRCRFGEDAYRRRYMPYNELDYDRLEAGQFFQADHHEVDFWVQGARDFQYRPWFTVVHDLKSRAVVGWNLGQSPNSDSIAAAYLMAFREWGIPDFLRIDNGRDYTSSRLAGITETLGITTKTAIPYSAHSKGVTERFFGTFEARCGVTFGTYCGNSALRRPECLEAIRRGYSKETKRRLRRKWGRAWKKVAVLRFVDKSAVPTLEDARERVGEFLLEYHNTAHRGRYMNGRTPLEVWNTNTRHSKATDEALLFLMHGLGTYKVGPNGVRVTVGGASIGYGANSPCLYAYKGREVFISIDPNDVSCCHAATADPKNRTYIGKLEANESISPLADVDELRAAQARINQRRRADRKAGSSRTHFLTAAAELRRHRREKSEELRATGTDHARPATIVAVRTGFETVAEQKTTAESTRVQSGKKRFDWNDLAAVFGRPPMSKRQSESGSPEDEGDGEGGRDARLSSTELLRLVAAGARHNGITGTK